MLVGGEGGRTPGPAAHALGLSVYQVKARVQMQGMTVDAIDTEAGSQNASSALGVCAGGAVQRAVQQPGLPAHAPAPINPQPSARHGRGQPSKGARAQPRAQAVQEASAGQGGWEWYRGEAACVCMRACVCARVHARKCVLGVPACW